MTGQLLKGKPVSESISLELGKQVDYWTRKGIIPKVATILVKGDPASHYYAQAKKRVAERLNITFALHEFEQNVSQEQLIDFISELNNNAEVHGIMVELPLPKHIQTEQITAMIDPKKDVDGVSPFNRLATMSGMKGIYPATPQACIRLVKHYGYSLKGKEVVLIGRGQTVGMPLFHLLLQENATVTLCHSHTNNIMSHLKQAEIAFVATGRKNLITPEMIHEGLVIVDAGINELEDGGIVGDVNPEVVNFVQAMSPTPGGVGTVTTMILFENLIKAVQWQMEGK